MKKCDIGICCGAGSKESKPATSKFKPLLARLRDHDKGRGGLGLGFRSPPVRRLKFELVDRFYVSVTRQLQLWFSFSNLLVLASRL